MSLAQRSVRSSTYTITASAITTVVQFVRSILLARLIAPEIFGTYAYASSFVLITSSLPIFGMGAALLHRAPESEGETALRVHFTISLVFNIIWAISLAIVGAYFIDPGNLWILWIILPTQVIGNLTQTGRTLLARRVVFRRIALVDTTSTILSTTIALVLAWEGHGLWALVSTDVAAAVVVLVGYYIIRPVWKPRLGWSNDVARYLLGFGQRMFLANVIGQVLDHIDNLWTGKFLGKTALGYYSRAFTFSTYPRKVLALPLNTVAASTYAELKDDHKRLSQAFFRVNAFLVRTGFLFAGILALIAPEFIRLLIGIQWLPMLTTFRLMMLFTLLDPLKNTIANLFIAIGKPEKVLWSRLIQLIVMISGLFILGNLWGTVGVAVTVNLMLLAGVAILLYQAREYVQFSLIRMFGIPCLALVAGMSLGRIAIEIPGILGSPWRTASVKLFVFGLVYLSILAIFERHELRMLFDMAKLMLPGRKQKDLLEIE